MRVYALLLTSLSLLLLSCSNNQRYPAESSSSIQNEKAAIEKWQNEGYIVDTATFAGGCFWCVEASFEQIQGVISVVSGYSGGKEKNPTYRQVSYGRTGHAEAVQIYYLPEKISYETLLDIFFTAHDPTQLNRQGPDVGKQYRSAIFYHDQIEKQIAEAKIEALNNSGRFKKDIVTQVVPFKEFWMAEEYHQDYEKLHPDDPYIQSVSRPKIDKVKKEFKGILKE